MCSKTAELSRYLFITPYKQACYNADSIINLDGSSNLKVRTSGGDRSSSNFQSLSHIKSNNRIIYN